MFSNFFFENLAVYKIMRKNTLERGRPHMAIWRIRIACWIPKATNTHRMCSSHCFSTPTMVARTLPSDMLYVHCLSCISHYRSFTLFVLYCIFSSSPLSPTSVSFVYFTSSLPHFQARSQNCEKLLIVSSCVCPSVRFSV